MADRFWVGGTAAWDATAGTKWATTSGGAGGASVPFTADDVYFDAASGAVTVTTGASFYAKNLNFTGFTGTFAGANVGTITGNITMGASMTRTFTGQFSLTSALTTNTVTSNGISFGGVFNFTGGGKWTLQDAFVNTGATTNLISGTLDLNDKQWTSVDFSSNNTNVRALNFGTQGMTLTGSATLVFISPDLTNMTYSGTQKITLTTAASSGSRTIYNGSTAGGSESKALSIFVTAGTDNISIVSGATTAINDLIFTGFAGSLGTGAKIIYGNLTLGAGMTVTANASITSFGSTSGTKTITSNGVSFNGVIAFNGVGGTWAFADNFSQNSARTTTLTNGTLDGNSRNVTLGSFALGVGTKTLTLGSGTWIAAGSGVAWSANTNAANLTVSASTGTISMTSTSAKTFAGGAFTWPTLNQGGTGALTIQQANTFANITNTAQPATITFPASTTTTVDAFSVSGTSGNLITINSSSAGTQATLSDASGVNNVSFCSIKDINATGGASWNAFYSNGNVDAGNNLNWIFGETPEFGAEYEYKLRSFTEPRRF
jgi:hypothetical protein